MRYRVGEQVGDYTIAGTLGSGGAGDVFRVEHTITRRVEAMKVQYSLVDPDRAERILREAKVQARLDHPHIARLHHAFRHQGDVILTMELVEGESLKKILERGPVPMETALRYARQTLEALAHAHQQGVVHRDITPANILVDRSGAVKLTDFGLAKDPQDRRITQSGAMLGSMHYASPEQIRSAAEADFRSDVYSCGVVFYELFTGRKPFDAPTSFQLMMLHAEAKPLAPARVREDLPAGIDQAVLRALEKDPQARFATAGDFLNAFRGKEPSRKPALAWTAAAMLALVAIPAAAWSVRVSRSTPAAPPPMPSVAIRTPPLPVGLFVSGPIPVLTPTLPSVATGAAHEPEPEPPRAEAVPEEPKHEAAARKPSRPPLKAKIYGALTDDPAPSEPNRQPAAIPEEAVAQAAPAPPPSDAAASAEGGHHSPQETLQFQLERKEDGRPKGFWKNMGRRINVFRKRTDEKPQGQ